METPTAFVLNDAIQSWRDALSQSPNFREGDLAELEAHLRDSVAALQGRGLTEEEAFRLATRRLGHPAGLEPEFAKINRSEVWLHRLLWMVVGVQAWGLVSTLSHTATDAAVLGGLAGFGYKYRPSPQGAFPWPAESVLPAALLLLGNFLALAGCVAGCCWLARRTGKSGSRVAVKALRRPVLTGLAFVLLVVLISSLWQIETPLLVHYYSQAEVGTICTSESLASLVLRPAQTIGFVVLTILLLRRRFRLSRAS
jgi:hypothetical protein